MRKFALVYRSEKKKIIRSNIDLASYVLTILDRLNEGEITIEEYRKLILEDSECEKTGAYGKWVTDPRYNEEENRYRRRLNLRSYFKDLFELTTTTTPS